MTTPHNVLGPMPVFLVRPLPSLSAPFPPWPAATNTGVPPGVTLTPYTGSSFISTPGTVIDSKDIHGPIQVQADHVTIKNSRVWLGPADTGGQNVAIWIRAAGTNCTVQNVEVDGALGGQSYCICAIANDSTGCLLDHVNMWHCGDGVRGGDLTMTDCYIHDFWFGLINGVPIDTPHADCIQGLEGDSNVLVRHNTLWNPNSAPPPGSPGYSNAGVQLGTEGGIPANNWTIDNNLIEGGGLTINMRQTPVNNIIISNNYFGRDYGNGLIGSNTGNSYTWTNNVWADTGAPALPLPG